MDEVIYVILVKSKQFPGAVRVSREAYKRLEAAQAFCSSIKGVTQLGDFSYECEDYYYIIHVTSIRK